MLCEVCERIRQDPERDWPHGRFDVRPARNPIGAVYDSLTCHDCGADWLRRESTADGRVSWTLQREPL